MTTASPSLTVARPAYSRIVLKLSGESLQGPQGASIDAETVARVAAELKEISDIGVQVAIMVGGGISFAHPPESAFYRPRHGGLHGHAGNGDQWA